MARKSIQTNLYNSFYIGQTNRNFITKFQEHRRHEMRNIKDIMTIINKESNHTKINILKEIEIIIAEKSADIFNGVISKKNEPLYRLLPPVNS